jgi:hypothetical protein
MEVWINLKGLSDHFLGSSIQEFDLAGRNFDGPL